MITTPPDGERKPLLCEPLGDIPSPGLGVCYFCATVLDDDHYCMGCHAYICDACDNPDIGLRPFGRDHDPNDHLTETDDGCRII